MWQTILCWAKHVTKCQFSTVCRPNLRLIGGALLIHTRFGHEANWWLPTTQGCVLRSTALRATTATVAQDDKSIANFEHSPYILYSLVASVPAWEFHRHGTINVLRLLCMRCEACSQRRHTTETARFGSLCRLEPINASILPSLPCSLPIITIWLGHNNDHLRISINGRLCCQHPMFSLR